jgi:CheY-like chemotaxis protein
MHGLSILVVEHLPDAADSMSLLLEQWGYKPAVVYNGKQAIEIAPTLFLDVVFLDIDLPDLSGFEVARQLRQSPTTASSLLVAISGYGRKEDIRRCKKASLDHHFLKPVDPEIIGEVLISWKQSLTNRRGRFADSGTTATSA